MPLVSNYFLLFVAAAVIIYYLAPGRVRWIVLLLCSYFYYMAGGAKYLVFIVYSTLVIFLFAVLIERRRLAGASEKALKALVAAGLVLNFAMLGAVKYTGFFVENINRLFSADIPMLKILFFPIHLPFWKASKSMVFG